MRWHAWVLVLLCACGEPILKNAPKPDPGAVAGVAAAAAAAATLASPDYAAKKQEEKKAGEPEGRGVEVQQTVPGDVFDRLDHGSPDAGVEAAQPVPAMPPAAAPPPGSPPRVVPQVPPPIPPHPAEP